MLMAIFGVGPAAVSAVLLSMHYTNGQVVARLHSRNHVPPQPTDIESTQGSEPDHRDGSQDIKNVVKFVLKTIFGKCAIDDSSTAQLEIFGKENNQKN